MEGTHSLRAASEGVRAADTSCQTSDDVTPGGVTSGLSWTGRGQGKFSGQAQGRPEEPAPAPCPERGPRRRLMRAGCILQPQQTPPEARCPGLGAAHPAARRLGGRPRPSSLWARRLAQPAALP